MIKQKIENLLFDLKKMQTKHGCDWAAASIKDVSLEELFELSREYGREAEYDNIFKTWRLDFNRNDVSVSVHSITYKVEIPKPSLSLSDYIKKEVAA